MVKKTSNAPRVAGGLGRAAAPARRAASAPHDDASEDQSMVVLKKIRILIRAAQRHSQWIEKHCGVSGAQLWLLQELSDGKSLRVGELARRMAIHQTTTSNLIDALETRGLIARRRATTDQRVVMIELTGEGQHLLARAPQPARGLIPEALRALPAAALDDLDQGMTRLLAEVDRFDENFALMPLPFTE